MALGLRFCSCRLFFDALVITFANVWIRFSEAFADKEELVTPYGVAPPHAEWMPCCCFILRIICLKYSLLSLPASTLFEEA